MRLCPRMYAHTHAHSPTHSLSLSLSLNQPCLCRACTLKVYAMNSFSKSYPYTTRTADHHLSDGWEYWGPRSSENPGNNFSAQSSFCRLFVRRRKMIQDQRGLLFMRVVSNFINNTKTGFDSVSEKS